MFHSTPNTYMIFVSHVKKKLWLKTGREKMSKRHTFLCFGVFDTHVSQHALKLSLNNTGKVIFGAISFNRANDFEAKCHN